MRIRIAIFMAYLVLGCILVEDALPYFAESNIMEMCESNSESGEKDTKKEKELENEWNEVKERFHYEFILDFSFLIHSGSLLADYEEIPDSTHQSIFSPPPDRV